MHRSPRLLAFAALMALSLGHEPAEADFNPFGRKRSASPPPGRAAPKRPKAASAAPSTDEARIARYRGLVLSRPGELFPLQKLVELYRARDGSVTQLLADLEQRAGDPKTRYAALVAIAGVHHQDGHRDEARRAYEAAMAERPKDAAAVLAVARLLEDGGEREEARRRFEQALPLVTAEADREAIVRALMTLCLDLGDFEGAKRRHDEIVARAKGSFFVRAELGRELSLRGEHARAETEYRDLVRAATGDNRALAPALRDLGRSLAAQKKHDEALAVLERALAAAGRQSGLRREILDVIVLVYRAESRLADLVALLEKEKAGDFDRLVLLGGLYEETGRLDEALATYQRALGTRPRDISTRLKVVQLLEVKGDLDAAVEQYERLIRAAPHDPTFVFQLADTLIQRGDRKGALAQLNRLEARARGDEDTMAALVDFYERVDEHDRAKKLLERLAGGHPRDPRHVVELGDRYFREGDEDRALKVWARIRQIVPDAAEAERALGEVYVEHDRMTEALAAFEKAMKLDPGNEAYEKAYANALERTASGAPRASQRARYSEALAMWEKLLRGAERDRNLAREARQHIVTIWSLRRQLSQHVRPLERRLADDPPDVEAGRLLAEVHMRLRQHAAAARVLQQVVSLAKGDVDGHLALERALVLDNRREEALAVLAHLVELDPQRAREYYQRMAQYAAELYRDDDAIRYAARAVELSPEDAEGHRRLGEMYRRRGQTDRAIVEFRRALAKNDRLFRIHFDLAELLTNHGDLEGADQLLRRVMRSAPDDQMVSRAVRLSMQLNLGRGTLDSLERDLLPVSLGNPSRPVYRRLLVEVYGHLALGLSHQARDSDHEKAEASRRALKEMGERAVKPLLDALSDERDSQQRIAVELLGHIENRSAGPALFSYAIGDSDAGLRARAMIAVGSLADPALLPRLAELVGAGADAEADEADPVAIGAAWAVARMRSPRARNLLREMTESPAPSVRALGALGLGALGRRADADVVGAVLGESTAGPIARAAAAHALGELGATVHHDDLVKLAEGGDSSSRAAALVALSRTGGPGIRVALARAMVADDPSLREAAAAAATALATSHFRTADDPWRPPDGRVDVREMLRRMRPGGYSADDELRALAELSPEIASVAALAVQASPASARVVASQLFAAPEALGFGPLSKRREEASSEAQAVSDEAVAGILTAVVPPFVRLAMHPSAELRALAVRIIAGRPEAAARAAFAGALADTDSGVRAAALAAATPSSDPDVIRVVVEQLGASRSWTDRLHAAGALGRIAQGTRSAEAVSSLTAAARTDDYALVREAAVLALSAVDPGASRAILAEVAKRDPEPAVRRAAERALRQIGAKEN